MRENTFILITMEEKEGDQLCSIKVSNYEEKLKIMILDLVTVKRRE